MLRTRTLFEKGLKEAKERERKDMREIEGKGFQLLNLFICSRFPKQSAGFYLALNKIKTE